MRAHDMVQLSHSIYGWVVLKLFLIKFQQNMFKLSLKFLLSVTMLLTGSAIYNHLHSFFKT